ncbi:ATP-dependent nuclease [Runella sp.]|uniref:ATP-dependent nuclease n=1 Tax=Runella sp. TaxID=1960881 RepID=UPI003D109284
MITKITINNFKKLGKISFPFAQAVVIIGPNNSGKSTVFQALCLWEIGVTNFIAAHKTKKLNKNGAVTLNRQILTNSPIANARFLWKDQKVAYNENGKQQAIKLEVTIEGDDEEKKWLCKAEFHYYNEESFSCKVVSGLEEVKQLYDNGKGLHFGFLQPMSGISTTEDKLTAGSIGRKLGEGKTAEVLRNICYEILYPETQKFTSSDSEQKWQKLRAAVKLMFGADLQKPELIKATGLIQLDYIENNIRYDISSGGRGFQQTLLLFAYMFANPNTVVLLDEPDAHLEVIRQREVFQQINRVATETSSQIIIASHSEIVLNEASQAAKVIALIENQAIELNPDNKKHLLKSLTEIGWEKYYLARAKHHIIFLEGSTDREMLLTFANKLQHPVESKLRLANIDYTDDNVPNTAVKRYEALKAIFPELKGIALFDKIDKNIKDIKILKIVCWRKRELENYFAKPDILLRHAQLLHTKYQYLPAQKLAKAMTDAISNFTVPAYLNDLKNDWWNTAKLSDDWLDLIFPEFYKRLGFPQNIYKNNKRDYFELIKLLKPDEIDPEIKEKLDILHETIQ